MMAGDEEREIVDLEMEVREMAEFIRNSRRSLARRLAEALSEQLAAERPRLIVDDALDSRLCVSPSQQEAEMDEEMRQRIDTLKAKIRSNMEAMPDLLKRIKGCAERVRRLNQNGGRINPVFKKRRKNWTCA